MLFYQNINGWNFWMSIFNQNSVHWINEEINTLVKFFTSLNNDRLIGINLWFLHLKWSKEANDFTMKFIFYTFFLFTPFRVVMFHPTTSLIKYFIKLVIHKCNFSKFSIFWTEFGKTTKILTKNYKYPVN